jgi:hypothetical protein
MITRRATQRFPAATTTLFFVREKVKVRSGEWILLDRGITVSLVPEASRLGLVLRPMPPDCRSPENLAAKVVLARERGLSRLDFYHYGFCRLEALDSSGSRYLKVVRIWAGFKPAPTGKLRFRESGVGPLDLCVADGTNYATTAIQSTSTCMPSRFAPTVVRAGGSFSKNSLYTSLNSANRVRSVT